MKHRALFGVGVAGSLVLAAPARSQPCAEAWGSGVAALGANGLVTALVEGTVAGATRVFATGGFQTMDGAAVARMGQWDGATWSAVGGGFDTLGLALALHDEGAGMRLFAGGAFTKAGVVSMSRIARWDGVDWTDVGGGVSGAGSAVRTMVSHDDGSGASLFVAGVFSNAGGVTVKNIARWDGSQYHALGPGLNGQVNALLVHDDGSGAALYAAGDFTATGDNATALAHIARWNGTSWSAVGSGTSGSIKALASGSIAGADRLVAGGVFANAGGGPALNVATWDGTAWSALAGGVNASVNAALVTGGALYLGGEFQSVSGVTMRAATKWDGAGFVALGTAMSAGSPNVRAMARSTLADGALITGGLFTGAGGITVANIAQWSICDEGGPDLTGDGVIDGADLAALLAAWGPSTGPADLDSSGAVEGADLAALLAAWGG